MRDDIYTEGIETRFSSTNQPAPEKKRVKKYKYWAKKALLKNLPALDKQLDKGNVKAFEMVKEWGYGKEAEKIELNGELNSKVTYKILGVDGKDNKDSE